MSKYFATFAILVALVAFFSTPVEAKKILPRAQKTTSTTTKASGVTVSVKFTNWKRGIVVTFGNLQAASKVTYSLTYQANGVEQGFGGSITDLSGTQSRDIVLGTCSHGVCRYDTGIKNAKFTVTITPTSGRKIIKTFRLKI